ncbi:MAG: uroporphyrinogen-III synthase [Devosia sp.]|nr:uroporphyrinogen-III synthase [Devosia sp.]
MRMLVTRPEPDATATAGRLAGLGIEAVIAPLLIRETLSVGLPDPAGFAALALTSANALLSLAERGVLDSFRAVPVFAVGERTATAARDAGFITVTSTGGTVTALIDQLAHAGLTGPIFYPAAEEQSADLARSLAPFGVMAVTARIYRMCAANALPADIVAELADGSIGAALFYSRRTAAAFCGLVADRLDRPAKTRLGVLCLSEQVAEPLVATHFVRVGLADHPSEAAMLALALAFAREPGA